MLSAMTPSLTNINENPGSDAGVHRTSVRHRS
jgi:hypothetical protein